MIEKIKTIALTVLVSGIVAFGFGYHYGQASNKALANLMKTVSVTVQSPK